MSVGLRRTTSLTRSPAGDVVKKFAFRILVASADPEAPLPVTGIGQGIDLVDNKVLEPTIAQSLPFFHGVKPANHALSARGCPEFQFP